MELENGLRLWLTARFDSLDQRSDSIIATLEKLEKRLEACRAHCDNYTTRTDERLKLVEHNNVKHATRTEVIHDMEDRLQHLEDRETQKYQGDWIKWGVLFTGIATAMAIFTSLSVHFFAKP